MPLPFLLFLPLLCFIPGRACLLPGPNGMCYFPLMKNIVVIVVLVALLAPASWAGGKGWQELEVRLGLVEQEVDPLKEQVRELKWRVLRLETKVDCLIADKLRRPEKCRAKVLPRP